MLYFSGLVSALILLVVNLAVWRGRSGVLAILVCGAIGTVASLCLMFFPYLVIPHAAVLLVTYGIWRLGRFRVRTHVVLSSAGTVLLYGAVMAHQYRQLHQLRTQFAYESIQDRLPSRAPASSVNQRPPADLGKVSMIEEQIDSSWRIRWRGIALEQLHEHTVGSFVNSPGFGVARMPIRLNSESLKAGPRSPTPSQPSMEEDSFWSPPVPGKAASPTLGDQAPLHKMHDDGVVDFIHPSGFGHVKDRRNVAGFEPHQFSQIPKPTDRWSVEQLDLVSLMLHETPVAYVSARLPKMDELRGAPTRQLDEVEAEGLQALRNGEDLFIRSTEAGVRMVGSLRAANQCVKCHDGQRGDLLGAFSYRLRPASK